MKFAGALALPALAQAMIVLPDPHILSDVSVDAGEHEAVSGWDELQAGSLAVSNIDCGVNLSGEEDSDVIHAVERSIQEELKSVFDDGDDDSGEAADWPHRRRRHSGRHRGHHGHHKHRRSNQTIYQIIASSNYTTKFAKLVDEHPDIVSLLNSTDANVTLFVPLDAAFERLPDHIKKPGEAFLEDLLRYHVGLGLYPAGRLLTTGTVPTALNESLLGDRPQRLRSRVGLSGLRVNFYARVVAANLVRASLSLSF